MKTRIFTIFIMVAALAMFAPVAEAGLYKVAGGGMFGGNGSEATLAISARYDGDGWSGNVLYINRDTKFKFHGTVTISDDGSSIVFDSDSVDITITIVYDDYYEVIDVITIWSDGEMNFGNLVRGNIKLFFD